MSESNSPSDEENQEQPESETQYHAAGVGETPLWAKPFVATPSNEETQLDKAMREKDSTHELSLSNYVDWLDTQMRFYIRNPQVCHTFWDCLTRLQSVLNLPITEFKPPADNS